MFCPIRIPFKPNEINYLIQLLISATETLKEFEKYVWQFLGIFVLFFEIH